MSKSYNSKDNKGNVENSQDSDHNIWDNFILDSFQRQVIVNTEATFLSL